MRTWVIVAVLLGVSAPAHADDRLDRLFNAVATDRRMQRAYKHHRGWWVKKVTAFAAKVRPEDAPRTIVYPFGGGDLSGALAVFPDATDVTTLSLEPAGDIAAIEALADKALTQELAPITAGIVRLYNAGHSTTDVLQDAAKSRLPGTLVFALAGLALHDMEPVQLRYFTLAADGAIEYTSKASGSVEIQFRPRGASAKDAVRTYRHIHANLDDEHMTADGRVLAHLRSKGQVSVMTKAASFLLWRDDFAQVRDYILANAAWMISDASGIPPRIASKAGFEQVTYGAFAGPYFTRDPHNVRRDMVKLWKQQPQRELGFRFGYPDQDNQDHLLVMRRVAK